MFCQLHTHCLCMCISASQPCVCIFSKVVPPSLFQVNSSLIFFLFSFQVHEKSILLSTLPCSLLTHHHPHTVTWFQLLALFSMYPLANQDGLVLACWALGSLFLVTSLYVQPAENVARLPRLCKMAVRGSVNSLTFRLC